MRIIVPRALGRVGSQEATRSGTPSDVSIRWMRAPAGMGFCGVSTRLSPGVLNAISPAVQVARRSSLKIPQKALELVRPLPR
jgi:hypothetical protein